MKILKTFSKPEKPDTISPPLSHASHHSMYPPKTIHIHDQSLQSSQQASTRALNEKSYQTDA